ncbi:hypothetical protein [Cohnella thermotolerans]|uniref:hypothetical protein n=1 Tax=Cohnella thermotolerans TaxID=329858 RepID=UPI0003FD0F41|nr:hypothetical protein [Cohnella thermotolerans]
MGLPLSSASSLVSLFLVFWTGSAWFAALHPQAFRQWLKAFGLFGKTADDPRFPYRIVGLVYGAAGLLLLAFPSFLK